MIKKILKFPQWDKGELSRYEMERLFYGIKKAFNRKIRLSLFYIAKIVEFPEKELLLIAVQYYPGYVKFEKVVDPKEEGKQRIQVWIYTVHVDLIIRALIYKAKGINIHNLVSEEWNDLTQERLEKITSSMERRIAEKSGKDRYEYSYADEVSVAIKEHVGVFEEIVIGDFDRTFSPDYARDYEWKFFDEEFESEEYECYDWMSQPEPESQFWDLLQAGWERQRKELQEKKLRRRQGREFEMVRAEHVGKFDRLTPWYLPDKKRYELLKHMLTGDVTPCMSTRFISELTGLSQEIILRLAILESPELISYEFNPERTEMEVIIGNGNVILRNCLIYIATGLVTHKIDKNPYIIEKLVPEGEDSYLNHNGTEGLANDMYQYDCWEEHGRVEKSEDFEKYPTRLDLIKGYKDTKVSDLFNNAESTFEPQDTKDNHVSQRDTSFE